jgi:hypothetical protein
MPQYQVELREWVEFSTVITVDAPSRSRAGNLAIEEERKTSGDWNRTGQARRVTVAWVSGEIAV